MDYPVISPKKLIEVALPLDAINAASAAEKLVKVGKPTNLHLWWARRPLAAARAVIFTQLVHDPEDLWRCQNPGKEPSSQVKGHWTKARARLFALIEDLVKWENTSSEPILEKAREEIRKSWRETCSLNIDHPHAAELFNPEIMPGMHDPFAGGGVIPLEAQRLGMNAIGSDLNPVAVLINKAMIDFPCRFANMPPANVEARSRQSLIEHDWEGINGLVEDLRYYGTWVRDEAFKKAGHLYPKIELSDQILQGRPDLDKYNGEKLTVVAWLWARTIKSPNPAFSHVEVPLVSTFVLSNKPGKQAYVQPVISKDTFRFTVKVGSPSSDARNGTKSGGSHSSHLCLFSGTPISFEYLRSESRAGRLGCRLMAIVADGPSGRIYLQPTLQQEQLAKSTLEHWRPDVEISHWPGRTNVVEYGLTRFSDLFTERQLIGLTTIADKIEEVRERVFLDAKSAGFTDDDMSVESGGRGARAYAEAIAVYLTFAMTRTADWGNSLGRWESKAQVPQQLFGRQSIPMVWDFCETNFFSESTGSYLASISNIIASFKKCSAGHVPIGLAEQSAAQNQTISLGKFISTDPPYYDNIGYSDVSDFFYVWFRRALRSVFPNLLATITVPKSDELVANPYRHGGKQEAEQFFLDGMTEVMARLANQAHPGAPLTIYYAFKQSETKGSATNSSGWETFLDAVIRAGLTITGTWPLRTENSSRMIGQGANVLASSIVLVCRPRDRSAATVSRRQFIREINESLPLALEAMTREGEGLHSPVAPVDLSQAIVGPGMAVFSRYASVLEADGTPMTVRAAMELINRFLAEDDFDADTQFCLHWFEQYGWESGKFGEADTLSRAKGTAVDGVKQSGVLHSAGGNVRLLKWAEYPSNWDPQSDQRLPIWEVLHQLIRVFNTDGETGAAAVFAAVQSKAEAARQLAYRLYTLCERKNWAEDARAYNEVVTSWSGIESAAAKEPTATQRTLFE
jgi:putative DNA methylase